MNVALKDCHEHLRAAISELRYAEARADSEGARLETQQNPESLRQRGRADGLRDACSRIEGIAVLMERYLALSEKWDTALPPTER